MDLKDPKEFEKWAVVFRKQGVKSVKIGEIAIEFDLSALFPESEYKRKKKAKDAHSEMNQPMEPIDVVMWSTQASGEIQ